MSEPLSSDYLTAEERKSLQTYLATTADDAPYRVRMRLLLLHHDGIAPELAAAQVNISIQRARSFIRAFNRDRMTLFPANLFHTEPTQE